MYLDCYATLTAFRTRQGLAAADTSDDARMLSKLRSASLGIDRLTGRRFNPLIATYRFDVPVGNVLLFRPQDCLALTTLTNGDATVIPSTDYVTLGGVSGPIYGVELDPSLSYFSFLTTRRKAITLLGVWGWHDSYALAWRSSADAVPGGGITSSATTFAVTSAAGADGWNLSPRFQVGQLLKIDSEYMQLVGISSDTLTVVRGVNGSTAATHAAAAVIYTWQPGGDIAELCLRWAAWLYKVEDAGDFGAASAASELGSVRVGARLPTDVREGLEQYVMVGSL